MYVIILLLFQKFGFQIQNRRITLQYFRDDFDYLIVLTFSVTTHYNRLMLAVGLDNIKVITMRKLCEQSFSM